MVCVSPNYMNYIGIILMFFVAMSVPARAADNWSVPEEYLKKSNPVPLSAKSLMKGKGTFSQLCVRCHGVDGKGNKIALEWWFGGKPDLSAAAKVKPDGELFYAIYHGKGIMSGYSNTLMDEDIYNIINYLKVIDKLKADQSKSLIF